ncbi:MAG: transpeptidase family protein [Deltaproteobacteria bacterium]|nr:transpeptidase family protein [Deltaproteobacteria bacterium]
MTADRRVLPAESREPRVTVLARAERRIKLMGFVFLLAIGAMGARGAMLCMVPQQAIIDRGEVQRFDQVPQQGKRGDIVDRHGRRLAVTVDMPSVIADPALINEEDRHQLAVKIADILEADPGEVEERLARKSRYVRIGTKVHPDKVRRIRALGSRAITIEENSLRYYPDKSLASQVLGFVNSAGDGRGGLEAYLNADMKGTTTLLQRRRDRHGYDVDRPADADWRTHAGHTVHTTLDRSIQRITERALAGVMERHEPLSATAIVVDVETGDLIAVANAPTFNPNQVGGDPEPRRNHAVQDAIEPGSVFKPFTVAAALEEGLVNERTLIDCEGGRWPVGRARIRDDHPHGVITATEVIKYSSNIGSGKLAMMVGAEKFIGYLRDFGFAARTGVPLPGERRGVLRSPDRIKPIELVTTAFGQGTTATPLQLAMGIAAIANDGVRMRPRLVTRVEDAHGVPEDIFPPVEVQRVVSAKTAQAVARMMITVTEAGGTATRAQIPGYQVAGKTGTAQKVKDGKYSSDRIGSFVGFVPAKDPVLAIVVVVDEPTKGSRYGGIVAAPAFAEIAEQALRELGVPPDPALMKEAPPPLPTEPVAELAPIELTWEGVGWRMPDLTGRPFREVLAAVQGSGLRLELEGGGFVVAQQPAPGASLPPGQTLRVVFQ